MLYFTFCTLCAENVRKTDWKSEQAAAASRSVITLPKMCNDASISTAMARFKSNSPHSSGQLSSYLPGVMISPACRLR